MADPVVILEPGDERAQKISKAMGSQTASDILQLLGERPQSLTGITERLSIPLTTAKYHVENLLGAGLISVAETKYSVKGREVKIYCLTNQLLIVAPRSSNVRSILLKYASLFCIVILGTLALSLLSPLLGAPAGMMNAPAAFESGREAVPTLAGTAGLNVTVSPEATAVASKGVSDANVANLTQAVTPFATPAPAAAGAPSHLPPLIPDPALAFFLGGAMVILVLLIYEVYLWKRTRRQE